MERRALYNRSAASPSVPPSPMDASQTLLEHAQQFSQMAVRHVDRVREQFHSIEYEYNEALEELISAYEKLSKMKWDMVRREYEASYRASLGTNHTFVAGDVVLERKDVSASCVKTPGKKKPEEVNHNNNMTGENVLNPHDWIADAFRNGAFSSLEVTNGKHSFSLSDCFPGLNRMPPSPMAPFGLAFPPPGFGTSEEQEELCGADEESFCSSEKSEDKDTTQSTSTPSEISSLGTDEGSCCDGGEEGDESSIDSLESSQMSGGNFDYVYKGGYAMKASNGKETKGVVPKTVKNVLVHSSVTSVEEGAFQGCNELESVTISSSVVNIRDNAFRKCSKLMNVVFLTRPAKSNTATKETKDSEEKKMECPDGVNRLFARRSVSATSLSSVHCSQLRTIGEWAFFNCSSLESVNLPYGLESIGSRSFQRCSVLKLEELPLTLVNVGENAFSGCPRETRAVLEQWEGNQS